MPFSLPKPALSSVTVQTPDFSAAADTARRPDVGAQKTSTFDDLLSRHAEQVEQTRAATPKPAATEAPKPRPVTTEKHKLADRSPDKPAKADKAPVKSADKPTDTAAAESDSQPADTASTQAAGADDAKTPDATAQTQTDPAATTQADASTDAATQAAAVLAAQAQAQAQAQAPAQAPAPADTDPAAQLAALVPQANLSANGPAQPATPDAATPDAPAADVSADAAADTSADPNAAPADFAALLGQAAVVPGPTATNAPTQVTPRSGKPATEKIAAAKSDTAPVLPDFGKTIPAGKDAAAPAKAASDGAVTQATTPFDKDQTLAARFGDGRDASQQAQTPAAQQAQVQVMPQTVAQIAADAAPLPAAKQSDAPVQTAFSIQTTAADVPGGYSATGAQTASATTLSKAAIDNMSAMGLQISKKLAEGTTKFTLELHPADLGKVEVALNIGRDGKTTAHLRFDNPVTASAFSANEGELRQQLANAGLKLDSDALSFSSPDGDGSGQAFAQMFQGQEQASHGQAARALQTAGDQADQIDADTALNTALAEFRNRPANSTLALNLVV